jgi:hypothetical protein
VGLRAELGFLRSYSNGILFYLGHSLHDKIRRILLLLFLPEHRPVGLSERCLTVERPTKVELVLLYCGKEKVKQIKKGKRPRGQKKNKKEGEGKKR